ncbi:hypothetical protein BDR07DRAFT_1380901 [Suillus spraguei]|nr:hypothetical protein BDR07DRAFT_1380901 [Suillus spraguei]
MDMNALTVDWPQAPTDASFRLANISRPAPPDSEADKTTFTENQESKTTYTTNATTRNASTSIAKSASTGIPKKKAKPKLTAKEKKERLLSLEKIVMSLPLEFRGSDPARIFNANDTQLSVEG